MPINDEPTGEVLSLTPADIAVRMGDKYQRTKPKLLIQYRRQCVIGCANWFWQNNMR